MQIYKVVIYELILIALYLSSGCNKKNLYPGTEDSPFKHEVKVTILGYTQDAMEPFISKDDRYLFFNNKEGPNNKDIFYAEKIDDTTFVFRGEVKGVNTPYVDANPSMDVYGNFYFISTRNLHKKDFRTVFCGTFYKDSVKDVHVVQGSINIPKPFWINMGVEVSGDGNILLLSNAKFRLGGHFPVKGNIRMGVKHGDRFDIPPYESKVLSNINTSRAIQYAGELSYDGLEIVYSEVKLGHPSVFKMFLARRTSKKDAFGHPILIAEPFKDNPHAVVEAPTLSADGKRLYYHKLDKDGKFHIFMLTRN